MVKGWSQSKNAWLVHILQHLNVYIFLHTGDPSDCKNILLKWFHHFLEYFDNHSGCASWLVSCFLKATSSFIFREVAGKLYVLNVTIKEKMFPFKVYASNGSKGINHFVILRQIILANVWNAILDFNLQCGDIKKGNCATWDWPTSESWH